MKRTFINPRNLWVGSFVPNWLMKRREITSSAKLLYARLCQFYNEEAGCAWPGQDTLAAELGLHVRQVQTIIAHLAKRGLLHVERTGLTKPNRYRFPAHPWMGLPGPERTSTSGPETQPTAGPETQRTAGQETRRTAGQETRRTAYEENQVRESGEENQELQGRPPRVLRPLDGSLLSESLPISLNGDNPLVDGLVLWHRQMGSEVPDNELRRQLAGAVRSLGEDVVKEIWRQARDADHKYREAHPGILWRLMAEVKTWPRPVSRRAVRRRFECVEDWSDLGNGRRGAPSGFADPQAMSALIEEFEAMVFEQFADR